MINVARLHAQQEYDRIMELVDVLKNQAARIKRRLEITDAVHEAQYQFQIVHDRLYWLVYDSKTESNKLVHLGPNDWSTGAPITYKYLCQIKWLGDHSWIEVDENGNPIH